MLDIIKQLLDKDLVTEDTRAEIQEAWDSKLSEVKEEAKTEIREEFAKRYEHDKSVMVEAMDRLVNESLKKEIAEFVEDRKQLAAQRVMYKKVLNHTWKHFRSSSPNNLPARWPSYNRIESRWQNKWQHLSHLSLHLLQKNLMSLNQTRDQLLKLV